MNDKQYTRNGPGAIIKRFLKDKSFNICIEIGVFEGATSNLIAEHLTVNGKLICIDPLLDTYITEKLTDDAIEHNKTRWKYFEGQYERFIHNTHEYIDSGKIELIRETSDKAFEKLTSLTDVDFCYVDGDHRTEAVFNDGNNCLSVCRSGGHILFDDYTWNAGGEFDCGQGVDMFIDANKENIDVVHKSTQVLIKKL
jgi:predicted O-methyltransferase YrrM